MSIKKYIEINKERFIDELIELLRIPSVSADSKYADDILKAAQKTKERLIEAGADNAELLHTDGYPVVYAEKMVNPNLPTVLVYGHYDVQPPDPLDLWDSPPFQPVIKGNKIYARGASDDKGQFYMYIKAFEYMMKEKPLPCNIKFMIEGEEEIGSVNLDKFIRENKAKLAADIIVLSDTTIIANNTPSITVGLRGLSYMEVEVSGPNRDLHSGIYGGAVANPINILTRMIASLHDEDNHITIKGFYDDVAELPASERDEMAKAPFSLDEYKKELGIADVYGEKGYSTIERASIRPTLDVNGIWGGYTGEGAKTVIPSKAYAKISMRLVPYQSQEKIVELFTQHFKSIAPPSVQVKVTSLHGGDPAVTPADSIAYQAASSAMETTFGIKPIPVRGGASIPIVALLKKELGLDSVLLGFGLDSDAIHSPNEHYGIYNYLIGIETIVHFFENYAQLSKK